MDKIAYACRKTPEGIHVHTLHNEPRQNQNEASPQSRYLNILQSVKKILHLLRIYN
ncbi:hypothetical protein SAMN02746065_1615 [Desulfocicer vacuolatum DSM 3385]|uniref:Uncharacterized protein n=1 Tax=Desulfocicer vacuolatum DSM 3385 TaxID=1121400 RepID=A0A1W2EZ34_9BACT|nr:hypothetical protein SAMN02746065_1615 [Desulfocicer vacuolatum DSM 3385]